jgi:hypothetical protein
MFVVPMLIQYEFGDSCHFQQYFSYIVGSVSLVEETGENSQLLKVALNTITHKPLTITLDYWEVDTLGD